MVRNFIVSCLFLLGSNFAAAAQSCVDYDIYDAGKTYPGARFVVDYIADIQSADLVSSKGITLAKAEQVLRQDRANLHRFGLGSESDTRDGFFDKAANRALLESASYVTNCGTDLNRLKREILQGRVPGLLDVLVFKILETGRYVVYINVVG